ncbi:MAG: hypothetical protein FWC32_03250 [Firmicutes bacterium]|nr:hypothetical protein [Bacillota bacterium]
MPKNKYVILKTILLLVCIIQVFSLSGCRVRIIDVAAVAETEHEPLSIIEPPTEPEQYEPEEPTPEEPTPPEPEEPTPEDPTPEEPTTDPPTEIIDETIIPVIEALAYEPIEVPQEDTQPGLEPGYGYAPVLTEVSEENTSVTIQNPSQEAAGDTTLDDVGEGTLGLIIDRHIGVLNRGLGSLFECQRLYVYFEHLADFHTVNRSSPLHALIIDSGGYNAAARRGNDLLIVDAAWVQRQNPAVIIRTVSSDILGYNITDTNRAVALRNEILSRYGFEGVSAIINRRVLLLSEELLQSYEGRLIAKLHIAHAMYPTLFSDINLAELYGEIADAGGRDYSVGIFVLL